MRRLINVRTGRHPHELAFALVSVAIGIVGVASPTTASASVSEFLPDAAERWYFGFLAGAAAIQLVGILSPKIEGLLLERAGATVSALFLAVFGVGVLVGTGFTAWLSAGLIGSIAAANLVRGWQINRDLTLLKSYLRDHPEDRPWTR